MAKQGNSRVFLEDWLKSTSGYRYNNNNNSRSSSSTQQQQQQQKQLISPATAIIQSWAHLRHSLKTLSFNSHHLQALNSLVNSQSSLHVADPQAKLLLSILSTPQLSLPPHSYPLFLRLLYVWARKSATPSSQLLDSLVAVFSHHLASQFYHTTTPRLLSEGVLLLGSVAFAGSASDTSKRASLELMCMILENNISLMGSFDEIVPDVFAGIGYALCSSQSFHYVKMFKMLFGVWGMEGGPIGSLSHGLVILHLIEWVTSCLIASHFTENIIVFSREALEIDKRSYVPFSRVMAAAGVLRTLNKSASTDILSRLRISAEERLESVARNLISSKRDYFSGSENDVSVNLCLQCFSLALARSGPVSPRSPFFVVLAWALLTEIFPLKRFYVKIPESLNGSSVGLLDREVREHLGSVHFKEAGAITSVFCNQYISLDDENTSMVENLIWDYCHHIYMEHQKVALALRGEKDELLMDIEKICESAFLMVVVFALSVTKQKLNSKLLYESRAEMSVRILVAFSCLEYFRRIRLPEYIDTIREVVMSIQENDASCISFVESIPAYIDLTNGRDPSLEHKTKYVWYKDEVQTARILFYLRVVATCIERLPCSIFGKVVAPTMFLYMGHPNVKVARASHSMFVAFLSSGKDSDQDERVHMKEQLVFYYIDRSLSGYPGITPFESMASGVSVLVRHLPAGSPATFYCIHRLTDKAKSLCREDSAQHAGAWNNWLGESESCKKILDLLLRLVSLVDIQVLPDLMKLLAQLIVQLPKDGQTMVLNELYSIVAESDDVTRKPTLVSWLQSLSYLCYQNKNERKAGISYAKHKEEVTDMNLNARL